jgi:hypothetical protein
MKKLYKTLWDTGINKSLISQKIVDDFSLVPIGSSSLLTTNNITKNYIYEVDLVLNGDVKRENITITSNVLCGNMVRPEAYDVIIGMDIIVLGDFCITNQGGKTTFSFRMPSLQRIDFTKQFIV